MKEDDTLQETLAPEDRPLTDADFARMKRTPQVKVARRAMRLTEKEFATQFGVSVSTLRDWEEGRAEADESVMEQIMEFSEKTGGKAK